MLMKMEDGRQKKGEGMSKVTIKLQRKRNSCWIYKVKTEN